MSAAKHTLAPWHTEGIFLPGTPDEHCTVWSAAQPGFQSGDEVAKYVHPRDASLIAAAPELLASLQPFVRHNSSEETVTITVRTADVTRARAAIAKATGAAS